MIVTVTNLNSVNTYTQSEINASISLKADNNEIEQIMVAF